jgi:3-deoxy-D-manno-octulosonic acid (KDO) 8-phosphate synthase
MSSHEATSKLWWAVPAVGFLTLLALAVLFGRAPELKGQGNSYDGSEGGFRAAYLILEELGYPVVLDVTHALQLPGGEGRRSGGQPQFIQTLARAGVAAGVDGIFMEVHENPARALSDGPNALALGRFKSLVRDLRDLGRFVRKLR